MRARKVVSANNASARFTTLGVQICTHARVCVFKVGERDWFGV